MAESKKKKDEFATPASEEDIFPIIALSVPYLVQLNVNLDGKGNALNAARKRVSHMWLQKADVEDGMDVHTGWKIEPER